VNVIVPVLVQPAVPLHAFDCLCLKLKDVSCALACCIGTTTTAADSIATAASTATITSVELFILSSFGYKQLWYINIKKNSTEFSL
jgi:hypothetical protein